MSLRETTIAAAWNVQGKPEKPAFLEQVRTSFGIALPLTPNATAATDNITALWLGPESWLLVAGSPPAPGHPLTDFTTKRDALNTAGGAVFDVTVGRVAWTLAGARAATVLGSGCPLDFDARVFAPGTCAQSLYGHVNALYCRHADGDFTMFV
ncbi:MAG: sarcosine oxidase subunit gamma family protein, partial [Burkholderiaceae bacterium]